jgi:hypothetical protein
LTINCIVVDFIAQKYTELAKKDRERYKKEMEEYRQLHETLEKVKSGGKERHKG